jgi:hypothetical protein
LIWGCGLIAAAGAPAASLVYLKGGDIWIASPDGAVQRQITTNGGSAGYISPTETDAGVIVAPRHGDHFFYRFNLDGSSAGGPWTSGDFTCGSLSSSPFAAQVSPEDGLIVYDYMQSSFCTGGGIQRRVAVANANSYTAKGSYPNFSWGMYPRWIPGQPLAAMVNQNGNEINTQNAGWLISCAPAPCSPYFTNFDISRSGWRVLAAETTSADASSGQAHLELWNNNAPPPDGSQGTSVCSLLNWADWNSAPRWSPDGSQFAWATSAGVYISPAPVNGGAGQCALQPTLVVPGGYMPDWGVQNVPGSTGGGGTSVAFGAKTLVTLKLAAGRIPAKGPLRVQLSNANDFPITGELSGGTAKPVSVSRKRRIELRAKAFRVDAHATKTIRLKLPKALRRLLTRTHELKLRLTATVKDPSGNTRTVTKRVTPKLKKRRR